jgi:hypothetical protein
MIREVERFAMSGWLMLPILLVVCGERAAQPVVNTGTLYQ